MSPAIVKLTEPKIRVLVVDDSALARKLIRDALEQAGDIEVAGCAADGYAAREQVDALKPDVLTLDIGMPGMDGLTFLRKVKGQNGVPAVVISAMTGSGCLTAIEALRAGAVEVIGKPTDKPGYLDFRAMLPTKIRAAFACRQKAPKKNPAVATATALKLRTPSVIAIGSSTGGTEALETILRHMPADCPGIVIAQHIPARFSAMFAERLAQVCSIQVKEAAAGDVVRPGLALIAPGDWHMTIQPLTAGHCPQSKSVADWAVAPRAGVAVSGEPLTAGACPQSKSVADWAVAPRAGVAVSGEPLTAGACPRSKSVADWAVAPRAGVAISGEPLTAGACPRSKSVADWAVAPRAGVAVSGEKRPGGFEVALNQGPRVSFQRPSVDLLLQSVAAIAGAGAIGAILTGMGNDGTAGLLAMKRAGAITLAQDEATCAVFGMPKEAIRAGAVDHVLPLEQIAATLGRLHALTGHMIR